MDKNRFVEQLLAWYEENKRQLPWRGTFDPYKIWLSEILLQQTRVNQGLPYYLRFVKSYPTISKLAKAPLGDVLRMWQGLGYYSRARNLHACSKVIMKHWNGAFPPTFHELKKLPGIGDYTAAAIASIAFRQPVAVVDGNVYRVLSRLLNIDTSISSPEGKKYFSELANSLIPKENPADFNQAMMEFGAIHCTPRNPKCDECIFRKQCKGHQAERHLVLPVKSKILKRKKRYFNYFIIHDGNKTWMQKREEKDIWQGLYEFYLIESPKPIGQSTATKQFTAAARIKAEAVRLAASTKQLLSHQEIHGKFYEFARSKPNNVFRKGKFYSPKEIEKLAKPVIITRYLEQGASEKK